MGEKQKPPKEHPVAWQSALWPHLPLIRELRRHRKTWPQIAGCLRSQRNVTITHRAVRNFFKRAVKAKLPLGMEPEGLTPPAGPAPPADLPEEKIYRPGDRFREAVRNQKPAEIPKPKVYKSKKNL